VDDLNICIAISYACSTNLGNLKKSFARVFKINLQQSILLFKNINVSEEIDRNIVQQKQLASSSK
jgi:hypothetical protein